MIKIQGRPMMYYHYCVILLWLASSAFDGVHATCPPEKPVSFLEETTSNPPLSLRLWVDDQSFDLGTDETTIPLSADGIHTIVLESLSDPFHEVLLRLGRGDDYHHLRKSSPSARIVAPHKGSVVQSTTDCLLDQQVGGLIHVAPQKAKQAVQFHLFVDFSNNNNINLPLDITLGSQTESSSNSMMYSFAKVQFRLAADSRHLESFFETIPPTQAVTTPPTATPTSSPSAKPSSKPSSRPSSSPSSMPSHSPTAAPSSMPSGMPSLKPSSSPSAMPTSMPSLLPSLQPSGGPSPVPSSQPSSAAPTPVGTTISETVTAEITLEDVGELDEDAQENFATVLDDWYDDIYNSRRRRMLRALKVDGVKDVTTSTTVTEQSVQDSSNTIRYRQEVSFETFDKDKDALAVVMEPFEIPELNQQLRDNLRGSNPTFSSMLDVDIQPPFILKEDDDGDDFLGTGLSMEIVLGIAAGASALICFVVILVLRCHCNRRKGQDGMSDTVNGSKHNGSLDAQVLAIDTTEEGAPLKSSFERKSPGYSDQQSLSTVDYDYSKAYGGGSASLAVSSSGGTLGADTRSSYEYGVAYHTSPFEPAVTEQVFEVIAPAGKLGVVIDTPNNGPPVVHAVKESSVLIDHLKVGDQLLKVDEDEVHLLSAVKVSKLISLKAANPTRKFTIRRMVVEE